MCFGLRLNGSTERDIKYMFNPKVHFNSCALFNVDFGVVHNNFSNYRQYKQ